jgi:hypothetical protein
MAGVDAAGRRGPGCLAGAFRLAALSVLGPLVAARRWWSARARGTRAEASFEERTVPGREDFTRLDLEVDVPADRERAARRELTELVVRLAEVLEGGNEVYHLLYRCPWEAETELKAVGPRLQALGDRLHQHLGRGELERTTSVWLALPRGLYLGTLLDPEAYDPGAEGEPDGLFARLPCRWGFGAAWMRREASVLFRFAFYVPEAGRSAARDLLGAARDRLSRPD